MHARRPRSLLLCSSLVVFRAPVRCRGVRDARAHRSGGGRSLRVRAVPDAADAAVRRRCARQRRSLPASLDDVLSRALALAAAVIRHHWARDRVCRVQGAACVRVQGTTGRRSVTLLNRSFAESFVLQQTGVGSTVLLADLSKPLPASMKLGALLEMKYRAEVLTARLLVSYCRFGAVVCAAGREARTGCAHGAAHQQLLRLLPPLPERTVHVRCGPAPCFIALATLLSASVVVVQLPSHADSLCLLSLFLQCT